MRETIVNIHAAKTHLSQLVALAEKGERITIARAAPEGASNRAVAS